MFEMKTFVRRIFVIMSGRILLRTKSFFRQTLKRKRRKPSLLNLLKPTGHVMHQQFNIQQLHVLSTLYLCVLYLSENKQRLVPLTA